MKFLPLLSATVALASAIPVAEPASASEAELFEVEFFEAQAAVTTRNDLQNGSSGSCPAVILIYARGSTEAGNMVRPGRQSQLPPSYCQCKLT